MPSFYLVYSYNLDWITAEAMAEHSCSTGYQLGGVQEENGAEMHQRVNKLRVREYIILEYLSNVMKTLSLCNFFMQPTVLLAQ